MIKLLNENCMKVMSKYENNYFDLAIVDPPYGIGDFSNKSENKLRGVTRGVFGNIKWNDEIPQNKYFKELSRISKDRIIWGANYYNCFEGDNGAIVWYKRTKHPNYSDCEIASYSKGVKVSIVDCEWYSLNRCETTIHPCQKPIKLYRWLLENYAKPGQKILDTHLGSGSSAIAAHYFGVDFVGCEIDKDYFDAMKKRFTEETKQVSFL